MVKRSIAICDEKIISIESLYRVVDGKQINDPEMLRFLRAKGREKKLFCPCQCGKHLMVVAGLDDTRSQHFREYPNEEQYNCSYSYENEAIINSRINLKCWMDECFGTDDLELRTKLSSNDLTCLQELPCSSISKRIAVKYYHEHVNLKENEIEAISSNDRGYKVVHIIGPNNYSGRGQYPEGLIKIQEKQGFVLILSSRGNKYELSKIKAAIYVQSLKGTWEEITVVESDFIKSYRIDSDGRILHNGESVGELSKKIIDEYEKKKKNTSIPINKQINHTPIHVNMPFPIDMEEIRKKYLIEEQQRHEEEAKWRRFH